MNPFLSEFQRYEYPLEQGDVIVDAGCYEGTWTEEMDRRYHCQIVALEPIPEFFHRCTRRFANHSRVGVYNYALFDCNGPLTMGVSNDSSGVKSNGADKVEVRAITLKHLFELFDLDGIALLKLNIETAEFPVLYNLIKDGMLPKIAHLQVQWHGIEDFQKHYDAIRKELLKTHEHVWGEHPLLWESYSLKK